VFQVLGCMKKL